MNIFRPGKISGTQPIWKDSSFNGGGISIVDAPINLRNGCRYYDPVQDLFYILGPFNGSNYLDVLYSYNPKSGNWTLISEAVRSPRGSIGYNLFKRGDWLYWGLGFESDSEDSIHRYNLQTNTFQLNYLQGITAGRGTTIAYDPKSQNVYCFGELVGSTRSSVVSKIVDIGGPDQEVVNNLTQYPGNGHPYGGAAVFHKGYCYVKAGGDASNTNNDNTIFKRYNVSTNTWEDLAGTPVSTRGGFLWVYNDTIYYKHEVGSAGNFTYFIHKYDITNNVWSLFEKDGNSSGIRNSIYAPRKNQLWAFGGIDEGNSTINNTQVLNLVRPSGKQVGFSPNQQTKPKRYPGTLYRNFIVRITQSSQFGTVQQNFVVKTSVVGIGGIQVTDKAKVDIRQVQFRFRRVITFQSPEGMNVRAFWEHGGGLGQEKNYAFIQGCDQGLDVDELFNSGYQTNIINMEESEFIQGGYQYSFDVAGEVCDLPVLGFINFFVSIPREHVLDVRTGGSIPAITEL